jgi:hypothetical protein
VNGNVLDTKVTANAFDVKLVIDGHHFYLIQQSVFRRAKEFRQRLVQSNINALAPIIHGDVD